MLDDWKALSIIERSGQWTNKMWRKWEPGWEQYPTSHSVACRTLFCRICFCFISGLGECVSSNSQFFSRVERGPHSFCVLVVFLSHILFSIFSIISRPSNRGDRVRSCWVLKSCLSRSTVSSGTACVVIQGEWASKWVLTQMSPEGKCDQDKTLSPTFPSLHQWLP